MIKAINETLKNYDLRVIVIERPYDTYTTSEFTKKFMSEIFNLKFEGYCSKYPYGIMPVSEYDFMATHVCLALYDGTDYVPISAFKSITSEVCKEFRVPFPIVNHKFGMYKESFLPYVHALEKWINDLEDKHELCAYNASWTMKSDLSKDLRDITREISYALFYHYYVSSQINHVINTTSVNFNVNKHQEAMGLHYLKSVDGDVLPSFKSPVFFEEPFLLMYLDENGFSELYAKKCQQYQEVWNNRLIINKENKFIKKKAA